MGAWTIHTGPFFVNNYYSHNAHTKVIRLSRVDVRVSRSSSTLRVTFAKLDGVTFNQQGSATTINISPSNSITSGNILAYRPNYQDSFQSNLGTIFYSR